MTAPPFRLAGLDHVVLRTANVEAMKRFYIEVLGCTVAKHNAPLGLWHLRAGASMIDLVDLTVREGAGAPPSGEAPNVDHIALKVPDFAAETIIAHLAAHGVAADAPVTRFGAGGDGPSIYMKDPDGNGVELKAA